MKKFKFPIRLHGSNKIVITQKYGNTSNNDWYTQNGVTATFHPGLDVVLSGGNIQTYGTEVVTPSDGWVVRVPYWYDDPMSPNGNGVVLWSPRWSENGVEMFIELRAVHFSEVSKASEPGAVLPANTVVGLIGNSGLVSPSPTVDKPHNGTHLHIGTYLYHVVDGKEVLQNAQNGAYGAIDPLLFFDINDTYHGQDTGATKDAPPIAWGIKKMGYEDIWEKILYTLRIWFGNNTY